MCKKKKKTYTTAEETKKYPSGIIIWYLKFGRELNELLKVIKCVLW